MKLLVVDVDDTLFDWLTMWSSSFGQLLGSLEQTSKFTRTELLSIFRALHVEARTSERGVTFSDASRLGVTPNVLETLAEGFEEDVRARTVPYSSVLETLDHVRRRGVRVVAHTDTPLPIAAERFVQLGLDGIVDTLFSSTSSARAHRKALRVPTTSRCIEVPSNKPAPDALAFILGECNVMPDSCVYLGDSKMKDIPMARAVGVRDVHAAYGCRRSTESYELLRSVSHWTDDDISKEKALQASEPSHVVSDFVEVLNHL